ncbi:MAG: hypothetical protein KKC14_03340 [Alphaproteobacteria bacterium]|nr:hypothetical protein [Alphaproteobacteria bacterium]
MKVLTAATLSLALALCACGPKTDGKESGAVTALRAVFAFRACTGKLETQFGLDDISGVTSNDMDPVATGKPGEWDVKFTADVTEKKTGRVTRYKGVCHVRRDKPTTLEAAFVQEVKPGATSGIARRITP